MSAPPGLMVYTSRGAVVVMTSSAGPGLVKTMVPSLATGWRPSVAPLASLNVAPPSTGTEYKNGNHSCPVNGWTLIRTVRLSGVNRGKSTCPNGKITCCAPDAASTVSTAVREAGPGPVQAHLFRLYHGGGPTAIYGTHVSAGRAILLAADRVADRRRLRGPTIRGPLAWLAATELRVLPARG